MNVGWRQASICFLSSSPSSPMIKNISFKKTIHTYRLGRFQKYIFELLPLLISSRLKRLTVGVAFSLMFYSLVLFVVMDSVMEPNVSLNF